MFSRVVVARLALLHRSARLRVLAWNLRLAGFLRIGRHIAGWWRRLVDSVGGYAGEGAEDEWGEVLLGEGSAAEGHDGCFGNEW